MKRIIQVKKEEKLNFKEIQMRLLKDFDSIMQALLLLRAVGLNSNLLCDLDPLDF